MSDLYINEPMLDMYIFETSQLIEQLEISILNGEKSNCYTASEINEIFRIMHTIKGSSAMMLFNNISLIAHQMEDLFYFIREEKNVSYDFSALSDLVLDGVDFVKIELEKIKSGGCADGNSSTLIENIKVFLSMLKQGTTSSSSTEAERRSSGEKQQYYIAQKQIFAASRSNSFKAVVFFEEGCEMENIRAFSIIHNLKEIAGEVFFIPEDIVENDDSIQIIREHGFKIFFKTDKSYEEINDFFMQVLFLKEIKLIEMQDDEEFKQFNRAKVIAVEKSPARKSILLENEGMEHEEKKLLSSTSKGVISVNITKLNKLMDLVGEVVVAEAMVTQNPDIKGLELDNFQKAARHLGKIIGELQDMVMSIRMVPISSTFQKMHRIVRDMGKKLEKEVKLKIVGEETEVDKNIIEHISDPLMHLVRNSIDHGIETSEERQAKGKPHKGMVTLEAGTSGNDVIIIVKDDGRGLNKEKILMRASENGLLYKFENEMTDREIYSLIFMPGFSTKDSVTEFSGRGVGMDVVTSNIEAVGGSVSVDSIPESGTTVTVKIPLTLAIIDGMNIRTGMSFYTIPITDIRESFRPKESDIIKDPDGNEMIMVRGECHPIIRLHEFFRVKPDTLHLHEGIIIMAESEGDTLCIFADELVGEQQVVVKALPKYIKKIRGLSGCSLLGDGSISLIIDIADMMNY